MKAKSIIVLVAVLGVLGWASVAICQNAPADAAKDESAPVAFFPEKIFEFAPVLGGKEVIHDFVIQNKGGALLKIEKVKTA